MKLYLICSLVAASHAWLAPFVSRRHGGILSSTVLQNGAIANPPTPAEATSSLPPNLSQTKYEQAVDFAKLSSQAYAWKDHRIAKIAMLAFSGIYDIRKQDFDTPNYRRKHSGGTILDWWGGQDQGLDYTLFEHKETKDLVLAFRGTEPLSLEDWFEDIEQIGSEVLGSSEQYVEAVKVAKELVAQVEKKNQAESSHIQVAFTGHSLGGGLATAAALATGKEAIAFDAAGMSRATTEKLGLDLSNESKIANFNVKDCFVSDWNDKMDETTAGTFESAGIICKQYGDIWWLQSITDRANFRILPDRSYAVRKAKKVLNHAWHVITYQLEHKNFV